MAGFSAAACGKAEVHSKIINATPTRNAGLRNLPLLMRRLPIAVQRFVNDL
jgi:hypothetical protein